MAHSKDDLFRGWLITITNPTPEQEQNLKDDDYSFLQYFVRPDYSDGKTPILEAYIVYPSPRSEPTDKYSAATCSPVKFVNYGLNAFRNCLIYSRGPYTFGTTPKQELLYDAEDCIHKLKKGALLADIKTNNPTAWARFPVILTRLRRKYHVVRNSQPCVLWLCGANVDQMLQKLLNKQITSRVYRRNTNNWDGYDQQPVLVMEYFADYTAEELSLLLAYWEYTVPVGKSKVQLNSPTIYFVSKSLPSDHYDLKTKSLGVRIGIILESKQGANSELIVTGSI